MQFLSFILFGFFILLNPLCAGKFDGISIGASVGANVASLKEKSITDGIKQFGANGKVYIGIGKCLLDFIFIGTEVFGRYGFFVKSDDPQKENVQGASQFGGYLKGGIRPTENILIYGLWGIQNNSAKIKSALDKLFEPSDGMWSTIIGAGIEYAFGLGTAVRVEGIYESERNFKITDISNMSYDTSFISVNLGLVIYW